MKNTVNKINALLELERRIVGVKLVRTRDEFEKYSAVEVVNPISYCVAVKSATLGYSLKFTAKMSGCGGSTRALGLCPPTKGYYDGSEGCKLGLYNDLETAAGVSGKMKLCEAGTYGVIIKPLEEFELEPDVVLTVCDTKTAMRMVQGYTYFYGMQNNFCMTGNQAVCVEGTSTPLLTDSINVSMFCSGTRYLAGWKDTEVVVGIVYRKFKTVVDGILKTVNAVEPDDRKVVIQQNLSAIGYESEITFGNAYYLILEEEKRARRKESK